MELLNASRSTHDRAVRQRTPKRQLLSFRSQSMTLLGWAIVALIVSLIAGALGFSGVAAGAAAVAKVIFGIFLALFILLLILALAGVGAATTPTI
jgi:uncharacterized membrane protein YtjA (UPF0391 family)